MPTWVAQALEGAGPRFAALLAAYIIVLPFLGTLMDSASILLICVPLFLPVFQTLITAVIFPIPRRAAYSRPRVSP